MVVGSGERKIRLASATSGEMGRRPCEPEIKAPLEDERLIVWLESLSAIGGKKKEKKSKGSISFIYKRGDGIRGSHAVVL